MAEVGESRAEFNWKGQLSEESLQLLEESDRGCVLVAAAVVDEHITQLLRARFRQDEQRIVDRMFKGTLPMLGSMWAKNNLAFSLHLYSTRRLFELIDCLREVRNSFAHSAKAKVLSRSDKAINTLLDMLPYILQPVEDDGTHDNSRPARDLAEVNKVLGGYDVVLGDNSKRYSVSNDRFHFILIVGTIIERLTQLTDDLRALKAP